MRKSKEQSILLKTGPFLAVFLFVFLVSSINCENDKFNRVIDREVAASTKPVPGNSGMLNISGVTTSSLKLDWEPATDDNTDSGSLQYRIVKVDLADMDTLIGAYGDGEVILDWTSNVHSVYITGLNPGETVYFNVLVRDGGGITAAYLPASVTTDTSPATADTGKITVFTAGLRTGNLVSSGSSSPRSDLDAVCSAARTADFPGLACGNVRALISLSASDAIRNFPAKYNIPTKGEVVSTTGSLIGYRWADILDGTVLMSLLDAGISSQSWWSGSNADGSYNSEDTCDGWTDGSSGYEGNTGLHNAVDGSWLEGTERNCNNQLELLCICW